MEPRLRGEQLARAADDVHVVDVVTPQLGVEDAGANASASAVELHPGPAQRHDMKDQPSPTTDE